MNKFNGKDLHAVRYPKQLSDQQLAFTSGATLASILYELFYDYKEQVADFGIMHLDVKLENIIANLKEHRFYMIDYETSLQKTATSVPCLVGTPGYMAPEVIRGEVSPKCDIYSLGVCAALLCGAEYRHLANRFFAYPKDNDDACAEAFSREGAWEIRMLAEVNMDSDNKEELTDLVASMITLFPENRPDIEKCIEDVVKILLTELCQTLSQAERNALNDAEQCAQDTAKAIEKLMSAVIHNPAVLKIICSLFLTKMESLQDTPLCVEHFIKRVHIKALYDCKSKDYLRKAAKNYFENLTQSLTDFQKDAAYKDKFLKKYKVVKVSFGYLEFIRNKLMQRQTKAQVGLFNPVNSNNNNKNKRSMPIANEPFNSRAANEYSDMKRRRGLSRD